MIDTMTKQLGYFQNPSAVSSGLYTGKYGIKIDLFARIFVTCTNSAVDCFYCKRMTVKIKL